MVLRALQLSCLLDRISHLKNQAALFDATAIVISAKRKQEQERRDPSAAAGHQSQEEKKNATWTRIHESDVE